MQRAGIVAIVGRANVGKSSLFNAIVRRREAVVASEPGTTRDRVTARASYSGKDFWLVDTAGMKTPDDEFELGIQEQITQAANDADVIMVVVESDVPITVEDRQVATKALKTKKNVVLVVNKIDKNKGAEPKEWQKLGIKTILPTSTTQRTGIDELLSAISGILPSVKIRQDPGRVRMGIVGRPNVGKSSLFNSLAAKQEALVSKQAGTTRDVNRQVIRYHQREIELADTAGIRRPGKIERGVEHFSVLRAMATIEESDVCLLVMDATELNTQMDQKIASQVADAGRGLIIVVNKYDLLDDKRDRQSYTNQIAVAFAFTPWAPLIFTSAQTGQNVTKIYDLILEIAENRHQKFKTVELNKWLRQAVDSHEPPPSKGMLPKLNYMVWEHDMEFPNFKIFGNHTSAVHWSYKRYLERRFREKWPLIGTPLKFWFIDKR